MEELNDEKKTFAACLLTIMRNSVSLSKQHYCGSTSFISELGIAYFYPLILAFAARFLVLLSALNNNKQWS